MSNPGKTNRTEKHADQVIADFGKAATVLHTLIHTSVPLTNVQREFIKIQVQTLAVALKITLPIRDPVRVDCKEDTICSQKPSQGALYR